MQTAYRGYYDDVAPSSSVVRPKADVNNVWAQYPEARFRIRFSIEEYLGISKSNQSFGFRYRKNGTGVWRNITVASSNIRSTSSDVITDDSRDDVKRVYQHSATFNGGVLDETGVIIGSNCGLNFSGNDVWEIETCMRIIDTDVEDGDFFDIKVYNLSDGRDLEAYLYYPRVTVDKDYPDKIVPFRREKTIRYFLNGIKRYFRKDKISRYFLGKDARWRR
jgi:hypothetical protein